jgi:hypothetical protein
MAGRASRCSVSAFWHRCDSNDGSTGDAEEPISREVMRRQKYLTFNTAGAADRDDPAARLCADHAELAVGQAAHWVGRRRAVWTCCVRFVSAGFQARERAHSSRAPCQPASGTPAAPLVACAPNRRRIRVVEWCRPHPYAEYARSMASSQALNGYYSSQQRQQPRNLLGYIPGSQGIL